MKPFFILTKRTLAVILAFLVILLLAVSRISFVESKKIDGTTNQKRVLYLESLGLVVDDGDVSSKEIVIPKIFDELYKEYNNLQKKAGFNLSYYKNKSVTLYTYSLGNKNEQAHLIIYKGEIIGGDIAEMDVNGSMRPLK